MDRTGLELLRAIVDGTVAQPPISATLGFRIVGADEGTARFVGQPAESQYNPMGQVHGGWACTLLDSAMGSAVMTTCDRETGYTTTQLAVYLTGAIDAATARSPPKGASSTAGAASPPPRRASPTRAVDCSRTPPRRVC